MGEPGRHRRSFQPQPSDRTPTGPPPRTVPWKAATADCGDSKRLRVGSSGSRSAGCPARIPICGSDFRIVRRSRRSWDRVRSPERRQGPLGSRRSLHRRRCVIRMRARQAPDGVELPCAPIHGDPLRLENCQTHGPPSTPISVVVDRVYKAIAASLKVRRAPRSVAPSRLNRWPRRLSSTGANARSPEPLRPSSLRKLLMCSRCSRLIPCTGRAVAGACDRMQIHGRRAQAGSQVGRTREHSGSHLVPGVF